MQREKRMEKITFYREWLPLDKKDFRILALLADKGMFQGNLSDLCRYFSLNPQQRNRNQIRESIQRLKKAKMIVSEVKGNTYTLRLIPKEKEISIPRKWLETLRRHEYAGEPVSWEAVLKVLLWIIEHQGRITTNNEIAADLGISVSTVVSAKNVLEREYSAITRRKVSKKTGEDTFCAIGQELNASAWWS